MVNRSAAKGTRRERQLVNLADSHPRMTAMRCPASGGATTRDLPDLIILQYDRNTSQTIGRRISRVWVLEVKADGDGTGRLAHEEIFALCRYALDCGATPLVAVHPNRQQWSFYQPRELTQADKSRGVTKTMLPGRSFEEVFLDGH